MNSLNSLIKKEKQSIEGNKNGEFDSLFDFKERLENATSGQRSKKAAGKGKRKLDAKKSGRGEAEDQEGDDASGIEEEEEEDEQVETIPAKKTRGSPKNVHRKPSKTAEDEEELEDEIFE